MKFYESFLHKLYGRFFTRIVFLQLTALYLVTIFITAAFAVWKQFSDIQKLREKESFLFQEQIERCEELYRSLSVASLHISSMNTLHRFVLASPEEYYEHMTFFAQDLKRLSTPYRQNDIRLFVFREGDEKVVTDFNLRTLDYMLSTEWKISSEQYERIMRTIHSGNMPVYIVWTDYYVFHIKLQHYVDKCAYIVSLLPLSKMQYTTTDISYQFTFDSQNAAVIDLRSNPPEWSTDEQTLSDLSGLPVDEISLSPNVKTGQLLFRSRYYDVVYWGQSEQNILSNFPLLALSLLGILGPLLFLLYFLSVKTSKKIYGPIQALAQIVLTSQEIADTQTDEITQIAVKIRNLKEQNSELKRRLEAVSHDILLAQQKVSTGQIPKEQEDTLQKRLTDYILAHLAEDISLRDIADEFGISLSYMSVLFKNKMDSNFKEYLSYQRYLNALSLMQENPEIKIKDVASEVGIHNVNTFIRIFKKYSNDVTPKQYLGRNRNGE